MEQQYLTTLLEAYTRGYEKRYEGNEEAPERKEHYFKVKDDRRNFYNKMLKLGILTGAEPRLLPHAEQVSLQCREVR